MIVLGAIKLSGGRNLGKSINLLNYISSHRFIRRCRGRRGDAKEGMEAHGSVRSGVLPIPDRRRATRSSYIGSPTTQRGEPVNEGIGRWCHPGQITVPLDLARGRRRHRDARRNFPLFLELEFIHIEFVHVLIGWTMHVT